MSDLPAIEKGIPIPARNRASAKYPLWDMKLGDSFAIPAPTNKADLARLRSNIHNAIGRCKQSTNDGRMYETRVLLEDREHRMRIWRTK